jgi:dipeptidyl aminopeptidase/acylaminoacyl peptidase
MLKIGALVLAALGVAAGGEALRPFSSAASDYNLSMDRSERIAVFARSDADFANARIMVSKRRGKGWTDPQPISFTSEGVSDSDPWLTPDGRTLYFVSDRPAPGREAGRTDLDIWRARRLASGEWGEPEHLGATINGRGPELGPELHGDTLTFSAARRSGKGGLDIYSAQLSEGGFAAPALIEGPINSAESDSDFTISLDGNIAAFWRGSNGKSRIMLSRRTVNGWGEPVVLGPAINRGAFNFTPAFNRDGRHLTFASMAEGSALADIFVASWR